NRRLIAAVAERLVPGGQMLLVGVAPSAWLDTLLATPGLAGEDTPAPRTCEVDDVLHYLRELGATPVQRLNGDDGDDAYLIHATLPAAADASSRPAHCLLVEDAASAALAQRLAAMLERHGHQVSRCHEEPEIGDSVERV